MIKIYARKDKELAIIGLLSGEIRGRLYTSYPVKGMTRKERGGRMYKVVNAPAAL